MQLKLFWYLVAAIYWGQLAWWQRIGDHSSDAKAGSIASMFDFDSRHKPVSSLFLDSNTGVPTLSR